MRLYVASGGIEEVVEIWEVVGSGSAALQRRVPALILNPGAGFQPGDTLPQYCGQLPARDQLPHAAKVFGEDAVVGDGW